jgi:hypothetical protein
MSDPKIQVPRQLCEAVASLRFYESMRLRERMIELEGGVSDLGARRQLGVEIYETKQAISSLGTRLQEVLGRTFDESTDCR